MTERKFTDEDLIKALECCTSAECNKCKWEPRKDCCRGSMECNDDLMREALDLITRQRAEIERLKKDNEYILMQHKFQRRPGGDCWNDVIEKAKVEAIKEFAESMKKRERSNAYCCFCAHATIYGERAKECDEPYIDKDGKEHSHCLMFSKFESYIDKLVKEMTEGKQ